MLSENSARLSYSVLHEARSYINQAFFQRKPTWTLLSRSSFTNYQQGFPGGASGKEPTRQCRRQETPIWSLGWEDPWRKRQPTPGLLRGESHGKKSLVRYRATVPWTEKPGRLQSKGSQRVRHNWSDLAWTNRSLWSFEVLNQEENCKHFRK